MDSLNAGNIVMQRTNIRPDMRSVCNGDGQVQITPAKRYCENRAMIVVVHE